LKQKQIINSFLDLCELEAMNADSILMTHDMRGVTKKKELSFGSSVESPSSETEEKEDSNLVVSQCNNFFCSCEKSISFHTKNNFVKTKDIECILWCNEDIPDSD
jgi:hypothetical protein